MTLSASSEANAPFDGDPLVARPNPPAIEYARETKVRDAYAEGLVDERPDEILLSTEHKYVTEDGRALRGDMKTVDKYDVIRIWEFKICADYSALGQVLVYVALARGALGFQKVVRGVIAAFEFPSEVKDAIEILNLNIETVEVPAKYQLAGAVPDGGMRVTPPAFPLLSDTTER
jgi:hypothetical protein